MRNLNGFLRHWRLAMPVWATLTAARVAWAEPTPPSSPAPVQAPAKVGQVNAGKSQARLEVRRVGPTLQAVVCPRTCDWNNASSWTLEAPFADAAATLTALEMAEGRRAAHVVVAAGERRFELVLAAPLDSAASTAPATAPVVAFAGETGLTTGEEPDRTGNVVELLAATTNTVNVVVGDIREDVSLCGRKAVLSPRLLHAETLSLKAIKLQRLPSSEREAATTLRAAPVTTQVAANVLTPLVASSGKGSPAALVDNDAQSVWTESRGGSGGGEFVVFRAPDSMGITGLTFTTPPKPAENFRSPTAFWVATPEVVYRVELPVGDTTTNAVEPAANATGSEPSSSAPETSPVTNTEWYVPLPAPIQTSCLAISLDTATENDGNVDVGFAEVGATIDVDEARLASALVDLDSGGDKATAAERLLQDVGRGAFERVQKRYRGYSEAGRMRALNVIDAAPCRNAVGVYAAALENEGSVEAAHGQAGLLRCRAHAVPALAKRLTPAASERARLLASVLVRLDPVAAVDAMTPLLSGGSRAKRRVLQLAFQSALVHPDAAARAKVLLADTKLEKRAGLFLMRALGNHLHDYADVAAPRLRGWLTNADFATRYLALAPAAVLASKDRQLQTFLLEAVTRDKEPAIRTEAARVLRATTDSNAALIGAINDPHVRVREAAVVNVGDQALGAARDALHARLTDDPWPLVRNAAVRALGQLPVNAETAHLLGEVALDDESPLVRRPAVHVLGVHDAKSELLVVRKVFTRDNDTDVRAAAATSLGLMCDASMLPELTSSALKFGRLDASEADRVVAKASLSALGRLNPPDLRQRLASLLADGVPQIAQAAARAALAHPEPCGARHAATAMNAPSQR